MKVGDRFIDLAASKKIFCEVVCVTKKYAVVKWENGETFQVEFDDEKLIPEEIYNSPLYKALQEDD